MRRPAAIVVDRRDPLKLFLLTLCVYAGVRQLWLLTQGHTDSPLPWWVVAVWLLVLAVFGLVGLVGAVWRDVVTGLLIERWAVGVIGLAASVVAAGTVVVGGVMDGVVVGGFALACWVQVWRITRGLRTSGSRCDG